MGCPWSPIWTRIPRIKSSKLFAASPKQTPAVSAVERLLLRFPRDLTGAGLEHPSPRTVEPILGMERRNMKATGRGLRVAPAAGPQAARAEVSAGHRAELLVELPVELLDRFHQPMCQGTALLI